MTIKANKLPKHENFLCINRKPKSKLGTCLLIYRHCNLVDWLSASMIVINENLLRFTEQLFQNKTDLKYIFHNNYCATISTWLSKFYSKYRRTFSFLYVFSTWWNTFLVNIRKCLCLDRNCLWKKLILSFQIVVTTDLV